MLSKNFNVGDVVRIRLESSHVSNDMTVVSVKDNIIVCNMGEADKIKLIEVPVNKYLIEKHIAVHKTPVAFSFCLN